MRNDKRRNELAHTRVNFSQSEKSSLRRGGVILITTGGGGGGGEGGVNRKYTEMLNKVQMDRKRKL